MIAHIARVPPDAGLLPLSALVTLSVYCSGTINRFSFQTAIFCGIVQKMPFLLVLVNLLFSRSQALANVFFF